MQTALYLSEACMTRMGWGSSILLAVGTDQSYYGVGPEPLRIKHMVQKKLFIYIHMYISLIGVPISLKEIWERKYTDVYLLWKKTK